MIVLLLSAFSQPAQAAPTESFRQNCMAISARPGRLTALCPTSQGVWMRSMLPGWQRCQGDIANREGVLRCEW